MQKAHLADIVLTAVDPKFATGSFVQSGSTEPQRGDTVIFAQ
jgi:hypothetical protein